MKPRGAKIASAKLQETQVQEIRRLLFEGELGSDQIGALFGVSKTAIQRINNGAQWSWLPSPYPSTHRPGAPLRRKRPAATEKTCPDCNRSLPLSAFGRSSREPSGLHCYCRECSGRRNAEYRISNAEKLRAYRTTEAHREAERARRRDNPAYLAANREHQRRYGKQHPQKRRAHFMVNEHVRSGRLKKQPCEVCGSTTGIHGHHDDYSKPLEVRWLCSRHHADAHLRLKHKGGAP